MNANVTVSIYLDKRTAKSDGTYPMKIRLTWHRQRRLFAIKKTMINELIKEEVKNGNETLKEFIYEGSGDYSINADSFQKATKENPRGKFADLKKVFQKIISHCEDLIKELPFFSFDAFQDALYYEKKSDPIFDVFATFENYIAELKKESRIRTAVSYGCTLESLKKFHNKKNLLFETINVKFLKNYEKWMVGEKKNSITTVGIYMRQLRTIYNLRPKELSDLDYPFGMERKGLYEIPSSKGRKIALTANDLKAIFEYKPENSGPDEYYFDLWKLQFLLNGANFIDVCRLTNENISNGFIIFKRNKTKRHRKDREPIKIPLTPSIKDIFDKYSNEGKYLLPVLNGADDSIQQDKKVMQTVKMMNKVMKTIAATLELSQKRVTTYSSRHSFATRLMNMQAPVAFISKQLGHSNIATTTAYLNSFNDETIQEWQKKLTDF